MNAAAARELQRQSLTAAMGNIWGLFGDAAVGLYDYLDSYGYIDTLSTLKVEDVAAAVTKFQELTGFLKVDGVAGPQTLRAMELPRCGCADVQRAGGMLNKWGLPEITYGFASYLPQISPADQRNLWDDEVTQLWEDECGLKIRPAESHEQPNIVIGASNLRREEFGRSGGVLAWCELPQGADYRGRLQMKFDVAEAWKIEKNRVGIYYVAVACHELGHGLGLDHGGNGLMQPFYSESIDAPRPGYDIEQVVKRYGAPVEPPTPGGGEPPALCRVTSSGATWEATAWKRVA